MMNDEVPEEFKAMLRLHPETLYWDRVLSKLVACTPEPIRRDTAYYERMEGERFAPGEEPKL